MKRTPFRTRKYLLFHRVVNTGVFHMLSIHLEFESSPHIYRPSMFFLWTYAFCSSNLTLPSRFTLA